MMSINAGSRAAGAVAGIGLVVVAAAAGAADRTDLLAQKLTSAVKKAKAIQAKVEVTFGPGMTAAGDFSGIKPNLGRLLLKGGNEDVERYATGTDGYLVLRSDKQYQKAPSEGPEQILPFMPNDPISLFYHPEELRPTGHLKALPPRTIGGKSYDVLQVKLNGIPATQLIYLNAGGLPVGTEMTVTKPPQRIKVWLKDIKLNPVLGKQQFAFTPPADFTEPKGPEGSLLAEGTAAPDFALEQPGGQGLYGLEKAKQGKKAVLVNFWFATCPACREEFPHLQKIYASLKDKGLEIVAVNGLDKEKEALRAVQEDKVTFRIVMGGHGEEDYALGKAYGVQAYPTNYLVDAATGKIVWRSVGFDPEGLTAALAKLGVK
jgi:thiol-disulfide isomerase/thioredoxin